MQAMSRAQQQGPGAARTFPPTHLEWIATQERAGMALDVGCFNGEPPSPTVHCLFSLPPSLMEGQLESASPSMPWGQEKPELVLEL